jgi:choline dehydrogenase-like flavoprotein
MHLEKRIPKDPDGTIWDIVVIGTGAGGAAAGFNLARLGRSVLFLERGLALDETGSTVRNSSLIRSSGKVYSDCQPYNVPRDGGGGDNKPILVVGCGIGGTTSLFSMVMDRFRPVDLSQRCFAQVPQSSTLPEAWPIQYEDLEPYYREAETLFRIRGTKDPLTSTRGALLEPIPPSATEAIIHDTLIQAGLHPYRLHYAREYVPGCDGCPIKPCPHNCRNDAGRICALPALEHYGAQILPECLVVQLETHGRSVRQAICVRKGRRLAIRGRIFVLALNALFTPALLLRSANDSFPDGLGNRSGMVGRNLMVHVSDLLAVQFNALRGPLNGHLHHGLSLNDFYVRDGFKLGNIHAHAMDFTQLTSGLPSLDDSTGTVLFSTIVEDFPYLENRVTPKRGSEEEVCWEYTYPDELRFRSQMLVNAFADALKPMCNVSVREPSGILNASHACGTCRFGDDPSISVLDRDNRIHDLDNTYVLDASFFPSSGGINPSLTIVANSLRVTSLIAQR